MALELRIEKVSVLPAGPWTESTLYLLNNATLGAYMEMHLSSSDGLSIKRLPNLVDINSMISSTLSSFSTILVVNDIAARNALVTGSPGNGFDATSVRQVIVIDATSDASVNLGTATYIWNPATTSWTKISETESMDLVLDWSNIVGKPTSTVAQIDAAVTNSHTHLTDAAGKLNYKGQPIRAYLEQESW
jgi:hypothetical protein